MRNHLKATIALLVLLPLPVLYACGDDMTGPEPRTHASDNGRQEGPNLIVYPDLVVLAPGQSFRLGVLLERRGPDVSPPDSELIWSSSDPAVASVTEDGEITALAEGEAWIYAEYSLWIGEAGVIVSSDTGVPRDFGG